MNKVVLAYSGGLDTSVAVAWLREQYGVDVVTLTVDLGGGSLREGVERRAMSAGASKAYVVDARETFIYATSSGAPPGQLALPGRLPAGHGARPPADRPAARGGRPARRAPTRSRTAAPARATTRSASTSPSTPSTPGLEVVAPMRVGMGLSRDQEIDYAQERGIEIPITKASPYSIDVNLWGRSCETGVLEDPWVTPPPDAYEWTVAAGDAPDAGRARHRLRGRHPGLDRRRTARLGRAGPAAARPRRRARRWPDRPRRGPPGRDQEPRDLRGAGRGHPARGASRARGAGAVEGPAAVQSPGRRRAGPDSSTTACGSAPCRATCGPTRCPRSGSCRATCGSASTTGPRSSPGGARRCSLYDKDLATYDEGDAFDHAAAVGFIEIFGLPLRVEAARHGAVGKHHGAAWTWTQPLLADLPASVTEGAGVAAG